MDKKDKKIEPKKVYEPKNGVILTWDRSGNCFVSMTVNNIPQAQFENWIKDCRNNYSGKRWDMITANHLTAKAYDNMLALTKPPESEIPEETNINPDGLMNGGKEDEQ